MARSIEHSSNEDVGASRVRRSGPNLPAASIEALRDASPTQSDVFVADLEKLITEHPDKRTVAAYRLAATQIDGFVRALGALGTVWAAFSPVTRRVLASNTSQLPAEVTHALGGLTLEAFALTELANLQTLRTSLIYLRPLREFSLTQLAERRGFILEVALLCRLHNVRLSKYAEGPFATVLRIALAARFGKAPGQLRELVRYGVDNVRTLPRAQMAVLLEALDVERLYCGLSPFWSRLILPSWQRAFAPFR